MGHTLRLGTSGEFKRTPLTVVGFFLFSLAEYGIFAPVYWIAFMSRSSGQPPAEPAEPLPDQPV
jgi:hypothetical protein